MAEISKNEDLALQSNLSQHQVLEEDEQSSSEQTLGDSTTNSYSFVEEDDDLLNVDDGDVPYTFNFDPFSPFNSSFFIPSSSASSHRHRHDYNPQVNSNSNSCSCCSSESESESESESDSPDSTVYPDCLYCHDEEYDQMDFITDLFDSRGEIEGVSGPFSSIDVGITVSEGSSINDPDDDFVPNNIEELGLGFRGGGLRVVGIESESDTEESGEVVHQNDESVQRSDSNLEQFWDCPSFDTDPWEESEEITATSVIDSEELSVSSELSSEGGEAAVGVLEWEILLAVNNLERDLEFVTNGEEGFIYTAEFDTLIGQFVETVRALKGSPPASKSIVDNLPLVALKSEDSKEGDHVICAVCKDEISIEEKVTQLPCRHHYHNECIVPWLSIRNTCPVCRFELPTDDVDYERSKNRMNDDELRVGYGLEPSP